MSTGTRSTFTDRHRSRRCAAVAAVLALGLSSCAGEPPAPEPTPTPSTPAPTALTMGTREGENGALEPWWTGSAVQAEVPADAPPHDKYRSEVFWDRPDGQELRVGEGDRLRCRLTVTPHLGGTAEERGLWQLMWQLHGPDRAGVWPQPPLNLHVRGGTWRLGGGGGRPDGEAAFHEPFPPFVDGKRVVWDLDVAVSSDPAKARVDAWLDGRHVVANWHPPSGTRYPDHAYLAVKSGLYTGTDDGARPPDARRYVSLEPLSCSVTRDDPAAASATP